MFGNFISKKMQAMVARAEIRRILTDIAEEEGVSLEHMMACMQARIDMGFYNSDPEEQEYWHKIPHKGKCPTVYEYFAYEANLL